MRARRRSTRIEWPMKMLKLALHGPPLAKPSRDSSGDIIFSTAAATVVAQRRNFWNSPARPPSHGSLQCWRYYRAPWRLSLKSRAGSCRFPLYLSFAFPPLRQSQETRWVGWRKRRLLRNSGKTLGYSAVFFVWQSVGPFQAADVFRSLVDLSPICDWEPLEHSNQVR